LQSLSTYLCQGILSSGRQVTVEEWVSTWRCRETQAQLCLLTAYVQDRTLGKVQAHVECRHRTPF
jgi:hypothetical protein